MYDSRIVYIMTVWKRSKYEERKTNKKTENSLHNSVRIFGSISVSSLPKYYEWYPANFYFFKDNDRKTRKDVKYVQS